MKTKKPSFINASRNTIVERLASLDCIKDVDSMLFEGVSPGDVARFIQLGLEELTDTPEEYLKRLLAKRYKVLMDERNGSDSDVMASVVPTSAREVSRLSNALYRRSNDKMDKLVELEALYLAQRDRLDILIRQEREMGYPFEVTDRSMLTAVKILETYSKVERDLSAIIGDGIAHEKLDLRGYTEETAETLKKPDSRRRVVSIVERLKRVKGGVEIPELKAVSSE